MGHILSRSRGMSCQYKTGCQMVCSPRPVGCQARDPGERPGLIMPGASGRSRCTASIGCKLGFLEHFVRFAACD